MSLNNFIPRNCATTKAGIVIGLAWYTTISWYHWSLCIGRYAHFSPHIDLFAVQSGCCSKITIQKLCGYVMQTFRYFFSIVQVIIHTVHQWKYKNHDTICGGRHFFTGVFFCVFVSFWFISKIPTGVFSSGVVFTLIFTTIPQYRHHPHFVGDHLLNSYCVVCVDRRRQPQFVRCLWFQLDKTDIPKQSTMKK